jgi:hypothetical protein
MSRTPRLAVRGSSFGRFRTTLLGTAGAVRFFMRLGPTLNALGAPPPSALARRLRASLGPEALF